MGSSWNLRSLPSFTLARLAGPCQRMRGSGTSWTRGLSRSCFLLGFPPPLCSCCRGPEVFPLTPQACKRSGFYQRFGLHRGDCSFPQEKSCKRGKLDKCCSFPSASVFTAHQFLPASPLSPGVCVCVNTHFVQCLSLFSVGSFFLCELFHHYQKHNMCSNKKRKYCVPIMCKILC